MNSAKQAMNAGLLGCLCLIVVMMSDAAFGQSPIETRRRHVEAMRSSAFSVEKQKVVCTVKPESRTPAQVRQLSLLNKVLTGLHGKVNAREGVKILYEQLDASRVMVTFDNPLAEGQRGPDYSARVIVDAKTGKILELLIGS